MQYYVIYNYNEHTQKNDLTDIHVITKRSTDLLLWIMVSGGWY